MDEIKQIPFLRIAIPFTAGIISNIWFSLQQNFLAGLVIIFFLLSVFIKIRFSGKNFSKQWWFGISVNFLLFFTGSWIAGNEFKNIGLPQQADIPRIFIAVITETPVEKEKSMRTFLKLSHERRNGKIINIRGNTLAYIRKDSASVHLEQGDLIVFNSSLRDVPAPMNPNEFDYKKYLSYHKIKQQVFIKPGEWMLLSKKHGNAFLNFAGKMQRYLIGILTDAGLTGDEHAVASALIIGNTDKIDPDIKKAYSATGAMHILSVSGLHVGIVFVVFNFFFKFFDKFKRSRIIKAIILIVLLWAYASITGLSTAVVRAAAMFSFVVAGKALERDVNILNTIAASAVVILIINPLYIADIGFQLSYLAVTGIVLFQPAIYKLIYTKYWLPDKIWALVSVSIAAQIATFPITLFHFHQFPDYFLLTNILVIPLSTLVLYLGLALFALSFSDLMLDWLGNALHFTVKILNETILFIEKLPWAIAEDIYISPVAVCLFFSVIFFSSLYLYSKKSRFLYLTLTMLLLVAVTNILTTFRTMGQKKLLVYATPGKTAIDLVSGDENVLITDIPVSSRMFQNIKHNWVHHGLVYHKIHDYTKRENNIFGNDVFGKANYFLFGKNKFAVINSAAAARKHNSQLPLDGVIFTDKKLNGLRNILKDYDPKIIIFTNLQDKKFNLLTHKYKLKGTKIFSVLKYGCYTENKN